LYIGTCLQKFLWHFDRGIIAQSAQLVHNHIIHPESAVADAYFDGQLSR